MRGAIARRGMSGERKGSEGIKCATVSWMAASPVTGYTLQQRSGSGGTWTPVYSGTATSAALTGLANGSYTYQLKACNNPANGSVCTGWVTGGTLVVTYPPTSAPSLSVPQHGQLRAVCPGGDRRRRRHAGAHA